MMSTVWASVPCQLHYRQGVASLLEALLRDTAAQTIYQVVSAFNEAFNNVVVHSQLGAEQLLEVEARVKGGQLELRMEDNGVAYEPHIPLSDIPADPLELDEGGLGLMLIGRCMDEIRYERTDKNVLVMIKRVVAQRDDHTAA